MVAAKIANRKKGDNQHTEVASIEATSQKQAATKMQVSRTAVQRAEAVNQHGTPDLIRTVESGQVPVSVAEGVARMSEEQQARFVESVQSTDKPPHQILTHGRVRIVSRTGESTGRE